MVKLFEGARLNKGYVLKSSVLALLFFAVEFAYQHYFTDTLFETVVVRSFALSGATLVSAALITGPLARLTKYNFLAHRRTLGVWGLTMIIMHYLSVLYFYYSFDIALLEQEPLFNVMLLGIIAFWLYVPMYLTSTDWAVQKLGFRKWKMIHRLIYFAYILSVVHFVLLGAASAPKMLLLALTAIALLLQLAAFAKTAKSRKDIITGLIIITFGLVVFYIAFVAGI